ncbi:hypothetical protein HDU92_008127 [Lobulomyces angularis]|nr:hypothetical protein HDU92_008127 [Lobulomyces angularis]
MNSSNLVSNVFPGEGLTDFRLGTTFQKTLEFIKQNNSFKNVEFLYSDANPLEVDLVLNLNSHGISLKFDSTSQFLRSIEIYSFQNLILSYNGAEFNSQTKVPTFALIYKIFGPIYPGEYQEFKNQIKYVLSYPGINFYFPIPKKFFSNLPNQDIPVNFADGTTANLERLLIFNKAEGNSELKILNNEKVLVDFEKENLSFLNYKNLPNDINVDLNLISNSAQDILIKFGNPNQIFYKNEERMKIHHSNKNINNSSIDISSGEDYFWNYFELGVDFLFDRKHHFLKKIIFHTNFPGHPNFSRYKRCFFELKLSSANKTASTLDYKSKLESIQEKLGPALGPPIVYNRQTQDYIKNGVRTSTMSSNPFGPTNFFGYQIDKTKLIFEIMKNGHISSVAIF